MNRNTWTQIVSVVLLLACLTGAALMSRRVDQYRRSEEFVRRGSLGTLPPEVEIARAALGTFRGLAIDVMWYRANRLKDEGKYYEAYQLSEWITKLQPRFAQVWVFQAWNMAYNISVSTHTPDERWEWVNKGIKLLREKAIVYNPEQPKLYKELNWIFYHKIGMFSDDMNWHYKQELALEWQELLGAPEGEASEEVIAQFRKVAEAPETMEELLERHPGADEVFSRLAAFEGLHDPRDPRVKGEELYTALRLIGRVLMLSASEDAEFFGPDRTRVAQGITGLPRRQVDEALSIFRDPGRTDQAKADADAALAWLRRAVLERQFNMDAAQMLACMEKFGPMDWRHSASHAIYWTELGLEKTKAWPDLMDPDLLNSYRGSIHGTQELAYRGRISFDPITRRMDLLPDPRFTKSYEHGYLVAWKHAKKTERAENIMGSFEGGYENFLITAVIQSYLYGDDKQAQEYYDKLRDQYARKDYNVRSGRYNKNMEDFVQAEMAQNFEVMIYSRQFIDGMLKRAFAHGLANGRLDVFNRYAKLAQSAWKFWQDYQTMQGKKEPEDRMALLDWDQMVAVTYAAYMQDPGDDALRKALIWKHTPLPLRQAAYDEVRVFVNDQAKAAGMVPEKAFPEPDGMEEYRKTHPPLPPMTKPGEQTIQRR